MTAAWHVGPIEGGEFWWLHVSSPEILVFLFFMITDPKTTPARRGGRRVYAVGVGLLATLLIAPQTTEFGTKVAILAALAIACAARGVIELVGSERLASLVPPQPRRSIVAATALAGAVVYSGLVVAAGVPARPGAGSEAAVSGVQAVPEVTVVDTEGVAAIGDGTAQTIARDIVVDLRVESESLRARRRRHGGDGCERRVARNALEPDPRHVECDHSRELRRGHGAARPPPKRGPRPAHRRGATRGHPDRLDLQERRRPDRESRRAGAVSAHTRTGTRAGAVPHRSSRGVGCRSRSQPEALR